jgi:hypothetical protein
MKFAVVLALILGCGPAAKDPQHPGQKPGAGSGSDVVCHEVTDTGTLFSHTECTSTEESQAERDDAGRFLKTPRTTPDQPPQAGHR